MDVFNQTPIPDIRSTFGALLLGGLVAAILSGMIIAQGANYLKSNTDPSNIRFMVGVIVYGYLLFRLHAILSSFRICSLLDISHSVTICMGLWTWLIKLHEEEVAIFVVPLTISLSVVFTAFTTIIAHGFFAWRIFKLSKRNYWLIIPIAVPAILAFVFACISEAEMIRLDSFPQFRRCYPWALTVALALSSGVDAMITVMMMVLLKQSRAKSLSLNDVIDSLFVLTLENGAITSLAAIICIILWLTMENFVFLGLYFVIDKLYGNSILAVLNYRKHLSRTRNSGFPSRFRQGNTLEPNVVRFSGSHGQPSPVPRNSRFTSSRSLLHIPAQICNSMKDKRAYMIPPPQKTFGIIIERSVEHDFNESATEQRSDLSASEGMV
ncbi:hypothetical protein C8J55DRAFT_548943 [Lentinula edodes]|uniref:DUF6534 domain-containing protein n=1 Tax=Lentinula lateritia TaxID=40482 RepID=A0A9W9DSE9_9AGAR|nr:hypothetical protein C8J55DRAFT_548943 [Lentinula edodes]